MGQMAVGTLRNDDPDDAAQMLLSLCTGGYHQRLMWGIERRDDAIAHAEAKRVVEQFLRAYAV